MISKFPLILLAITVLVASNAHAKAWDDINDPSGLNPAYQYNFSALPLTGNLAVNPWANTYWESALGSINLRWNQPNPQGFNYSLNTLEQLKAMTRDQLATLSPSEKFDIYNGSYDYPLHKEVSGFASPHDASWKGLCDGWSMSSVQYVEPVAKDVTNADGIVIPFGSSDTKALLSYYAQMRSGVKQIYVGGQCTKLGALFHKEACSDINPGTLHVIMANQLGLMKKAFMVDRDPGSQIWNQPVYGFTTTVVGSAQSDEPKAASGVLVHSILYYTDELKNSLWTPVVNTPAFTFDKIEMDYILDLDAAGNIIGGSYQNNSDHPDLAWLPDSQIKIEGDFSNLNNLIQ
jgi:hypothetical protein